MVKINIDFGPQQEPITPEAIEEMLTVSPRRFRMADFHQPLKEPGKFGEDWNVRFPFPETFINAFESCDVDHIPFRSNPGPSCFTFLKNVSDADVERVKAWFNVISPYVALRDCLALSFALDYDREDGDPRRPQTEIGKLRKRAKPYDGKPTDDTFKAADELIKACLEFLKKVECYNSVDVVVAMPPSDPNKAFDLPSYLVAGIARGLDLADFSGAIRTKARRPSIKDTEILFKLQELKGTIEVDQKVFKDKVVLLVDDLYQSGVSMNYTAMLLLEAGAKKVFGLACEKTCRNDDNVSEREKK